MLTFGRLYGDVGITYIDAFLAYLYFCCSHYTKVIYIYKYKQFARSACSHKLFYLDICYIYIIILYHQMNNRFFEIILIKFNVRKNGCFFTQFITYLYYVILLPDKTIKR